MRRHRLTLVTAVVATLVLSFTTSAAAETRSGSGSDGTDPEWIPGVDIVSVSASYDTAGSLSVAVTTLGPPPVTEEAVLVARIGLLSGGECVAPVAVALGTYSQPPIVVWTTGTGEGEGTETISGATTTLSASGPALANQPYNCLEPAIFETEGAKLGDLIDGLAAPISLVGPPPPAPPSPPAPTPAPAPAPAPPPPPKANLVAPSKTVTLHRNAWKKVTVKITNTGNATAGKVTVKIGKARGVATKPKSGTVKLKSIAAGKSKIASFKAKLTAKAKASSKLTLTIRGKGLKTTGALTLEAWKKPPPKKKGKKGEEPVPANPPLAEKIFYTYKSEVSESAKLIGYAFIDGEWAYHGIPAEGLPTCTSESGEGSKEGAEGCVKYSYDPTTGTVKVGSATGKLNPGGDLEVDGETYSATSIPPAGTRLQLEQEYIGYQGICGLITGCSTWHLRLTLATNGEFILSKESLTTAGGTGPGETFVAAGNYPPDQHGTYSVEKGARIKLSFADGTTDTRTFAYFLNKEGKPDPTYEGVLLGTEYFTFANDD